MLAVFQASGLRSRTSYLRLIELASVALHQIAALLYLNDTRLHDQADDPEYFIEKMTLWKWRAPPEWLVEGCILQDLPPWLTLFMPPYYCFKSKYLNGLADVVGYWAEDWLLGRVVLFDRSRTWDNDDEPNFYMHSARKEATFRLWQVKEDKQKALEEFLLSSPGTRQQNGPLPLLPIRGHQVWIDPEGAIANLFRA
ncbi:hypothetical protein N0V88_004907 [Collariella sp. IMI 366227]|nr:hypothetical protein N0V88_004907 [Collariella sp. IMI 366227]